MCPWLPGEIAALDAPADLGETAGVLGHFLTALHQPGPEDAPANPYRGGPLATRSPSMEQRVEQMDGVIDGAAVLECWHDVVATPRWAGPPLWLHGDLHPLNLLVDRGRLCAVIDFGDITAGDPATDLSVAWMLFPPEIRPLFRVAAGNADDDTWRRARGWALSLGLAYVASSADNPTLERVGLHTVEAALADSG